MGISRLEGTVEDVTSGGSEAEGVAAQDYRGRRVP